MKNLDIIVLSCMLFAINTACSLQNKSNLNASNVSPANGEQNNIPGNSNSSSKEVQILASPETVTVSLTRKRGNKIETVAKDDVFLKGDGARLKISIVNDGFLSIVYKGSSGKVERLFPGKNYNSGGNSVKSNQVITIPDAGWFFFDKNSGVETIYVIYAASPDKPLGKSVAGKEINFNTPPEEMEKYLSDINNDANNEAFTTPGGSLVRRILLNHQ